MCINERSILITGGYGFLGRAVARHFKSDGYRVVGIGRGRWSAAEAASAGFDVWLDASVSLPSLMTLRETFGLVFHCAGNGSVGYSLKNPLQDFYKTVQGTAELLEYVRLCNSSALVIYPSSAGVYGDIGDVRIRESAKADPISPYGVHKSIAENLLISYSKTFGTRVAIIRFFSIYGPGLTKQLLWDASIKLMRSPTESATFSGTGDETRDWIFSEDAARLVRSVASTRGRLTIINGASGERVTVRATLERLRAALHVDKRIEFDGIVREGDPKFYHADIERAFSTGWRPEIQLPVGLARYADWFLNNEREFT